jgi:CubicO group peptidase (beta-lactamase class C family)
LQASQIASRSPGAYVALRESGTEWETALRYLNVLGLAFAIGFAGEAAFASPASAEEILAADTPLTTARGTTFTAPSGWRVSSEANKTVLDPPEADSHLTIIEVEAADSDTAIAAAWASYRPDANRPLMVATRQPPDNGWQERHLYSYETSPDEKAVVYALAWRDWTVVIVEATDATIEKRDAAFSLAIGSLSPKGYQPETFADRRPRALDAERIALLKQFVLDMMQQFRIPGVGLGLIDGGKVVFEGGFGVRMLGKPEPVDADTLFLAASNTKAMTTLLLAELVDEGKLRWDEPVTEAYPDFRLGDADTTRRVLVRHLVCACTGLPRQDFEWLFNFGGATPASSLATLGTMQPTSRFGEVFQYSNLMAAAAGYVAASVLSPQQELGAAYDEAMRSKVFEPLGMTYTTFNFPMALAGNFASPHDDDANGKTVPARMDPNYSVVAVRPGGGMWTSAHDLSNYLRMELALGQLPGGDQLVSRENLLERRRAQVPISEGAAYGMGLVISVQKGIQVIGYGGSLFGYKSEMIFLPDHGVGAVTLTNSDSGAYLTGLFTRRLLEVLFDGQPQAVEIAKAQNVERHAIGAKVLERLAIPADAAEVDKLADRYSSPALGTLRVRTEHGATIFDFGKWYSAVASRKNNDGTTSFITIDPTVDGFNFVAGEQDGKRVLIIRDAQHEYAFTESASP